MAQLKSKNKDTVNLLESLNLNSQSEDKTTIKSDNKKLTERVNADIVVGAGEVLLDVSLQTLSRQSRYFECDS